MNQGSFQAYKNQVYNPGSPNPNPRTSPLRSLPKEQNSPYLSTPDPENPLKITFSCKRKRPVESPSPGSPKKKPKMATKEEMEEMNEKLLQRFLDAQATSSRSLCQELKQELRGEIGGIKDKLDSLHEKHETLASEAKKDKENSDSRIKALEEKMEELQNQNKGHNIEEEGNSIQAAVQNYVDNASESSWKAHLAHEVFNHDHGLVVHGVRMDAKNEVTRREAARKFIQEELKAPEDIMNRIKIKDVVRLGADNGAGKPPPFLIKFGHPTERNLLLPLSRNLQRGIDIDKNIPKMYLAKHKEFKREAWKLKTVHDVQTQVVFDSHNLVLRYKKKDDGVTKYNWTIEKEYFPKPGEAATTMNRASARDPNKHDTPLIDTSNKAECNRTIIVTGVCESVNRDNASQIFHNYIDSKDHGHLERVDVKSKGTVVITCKDWAGCKHIADTYSKKQMQDKNMYFTLFSEKNPDDSESLPNVGSLAAPNML